MTERRRKYRDEKILDAVAYLILSIGLGVITLPVLIMLSTALTEDAYTIIFPDNFIPDKLFWNNFYDIFRLVPLAAGYRNSFTVAATVSIVGILVSATAAFAFAKLRFPGKRAIFTVLLTTMMIPYAVVLIPQYWMFSRLGWVNTLLPLITPGLFGNVAAIFFLRQYYAGVPDSLIDAARIDGLSYPGVLSRIVLPLALPAIAAQMILSFMGAWNDFFGPLIYLNSLDRQTLPVMLTNFQGLYSSNWSYIMAAALLSMIPLIVVFIFAQKYIIKSLALSGLKF